MMIQHAFPGTEVVSGITMVDTSVYPWPGATFGMASTENGQLVAASYAELAMQLGIDVATIVTVRQVHGTDVVVVGDVRPDAETCADALVTNRRQWVLGVKLADCCCVLMIDDVHDVVAAVHSGWRGTAGNIVDATLRVMNTEFGTVADQVRAWLSPCASGACYRVREDVYSVLAPFCSPVHGSSSQWTFDNHTAILHQLRSAGVPEASIVIDRSCTISDQRWHSHRRDGERAGRMLAFIGLRPMAGK